MLDNKLSLIERINDDDDVRIVSSDLDKCALTFTTLLQIMYCLLPLSRKLYVCVLCMIRRNNMKTSNNVLRAIVITVTSAYE
jgi:hypothetical protein